MFLNVFLAGGGDSDDDYDDMFGRQKVLLSEWRLSVFPLGAPKFAAESTFFVPAITALGPTKVEIRLTFLTFPVSGRTVIIWNCDAKSAENHWEFSMLADISGLKSCGPAVKYRARCNADSMDEAPVMVLSAPYDRFVATHTKMHDFTSFRVFRIDWPDEQDKKLAGPRTPVITWETSVQTPHMAIVAAFPDAPYFLACHPDLPEPSSDPDTLPRHT